MKFLFLDDNERRWDHFKVLQEKYWDTHEFDWASTADQCIEMLSATEYSGVSLDHDLGGEQMVESGKGTGFEVAEWIAANQSGRYPVILHSWNPAGVANMKAVLPYAVVQRFELAQ